MARQRSGKAKAVRSKARPVSRKDAKMKKWNTAADIPLDEEDQFHASRDKILLEDDDEGGSDDGDEEEVFALKGMPDDSDSEDEHGEGDGMDEDDDIDEAHYAAFAAAEKEKEKEKAKAKAKSKGKGKKGKKDESEDESASESEEEGWGTKKSAYYASNAEQIESDDEEANELEEQEARRLQTKARDVMADDDFGLGDVAEAAPDADGFVDEPAQPVVQLPQDKQSLLRHLEKTNPEALALANDWEDVAYSLVKSKNRLEKLQQEDSNEFTFSMLHIHHQALLTYATTLAFYLHLRASEKYAQRPELLESHPILARLLSLKQSLQNLEDLDLAPTDDDDAEDDFDEDESELDWEEDAQNLWTGTNSFKTKGKGLEQDELEELLRDANDILVEGEGDDTSPRTKKPKRKSKAVNDKSEPEPPKKKRKAADATPKAVTPVFDLVEPELGPSHPSKSESKAISKARSVDALTPSSTDVDVDVYGEASTLDAADAADKQARKKSLRFHVARIESTAARRAGARAGAIGGDDDIPYRERKREKEARRAREVALARARGDDLDDVDPEVEMGGDGQGKGKDKGKKRGRDEDGDEDEADGDGDGGEGEDGYYELVRRKSKEKKEKKKEEYEAVLAAARHVDEETVDGPRSLTRAIIKNRGLTPKRSKAARNPRVKKRQKYDQAKKRVASQKAIYKGGVDATKYSGEKTGISQTRKGIRLS